MVFKLNGGGGGDMRNGNSQKLIERYLPRCVTECVSQRGKQMFLKNKKKNRGSNRTLISLSEKPLFENVNFIFLFDHLHVDYSEVMRKQCN